MLKMDVTQLLFEVTLLLLPGERNFITFPNSLNASKAGIQVLGHELYSNEPKLNLKELYNAILSLAVYNKWNLAETEFSKILQVNFC